MTRKDVDAVYRSIRYAAKKINDNFIDFSYVGGELIPDRFSRERAITVFLIAVDTQSLSETHPPCRLKKINGSLIDKAKKEFYPIGRGSYYIDELYRKFIKIVQEYKYYFGDDEFCESMAYEILCLVLGVEYINNCVDSGENLDILTPMRIEISNNISYHIFEAVNYNNRRFGNIENALKIGAVAILSVISFVVIYIAVVLAIILLSDKVLNPIFINMPRLTQIQVFIISCLAAYGGTVAGYGATIYITAIIADKLFTENYLPTAVLRIMYVVAGAVLIYCIPSIVYNIATKEGVSLLLITSAITIYNVFYKFDNVIDFFDSI